MFSVETNIDTDIDKSVRSCKDMSTIKTSLFSKGLKNIFKVIQMCVNDYQSSVSQPN